MGRRSPARRGARHEGMVYAVLKAIGQGQCRKAPPDRSPAVPRPTRTTLTSACITQQAAQRIPTEFTGIVGVSASPSPPPFGGGG